MSIRSLKNKTRKEITQKLKSLDKNQINSQSIITANTILSSNTFKNARSVGIYMHLPENELKTDYLIDQCFKLNKKIYLPRIELLEKFNDSKNFDQQKTCLHFLSVNSKIEIDSLKTRGKYQIREPDYYDNNSNDLLLNKEKLDILLLPGVAFTKDCKRLGHGAGFYDDFIKRYRLQHNDIPILVGIGLPVQLLNDSNLLSLEDHDEPLDYVIIGNKTFHK